MHNEEVTLYDTQKPRFYQFRCTLANGDEHRYSTYMEYATQHLAFEALYLWANGKVRLYSSDLVEATLVFKEYV